MAFNNGNNNNRNKINTTTRMLKLYNQEVDDDSSVLSLGYWNEYVSFSINPILPPSERSGGKIYNYEKQASALINFEGLLQLQMGIKLLEAGKYSSIAVRTTTNIVIKIAEAGEYENINCRSISLWSYTEDGTVEGNAFFLFSKPKDSYLMLNYDEENVHYKKKTIITTWEMFKRFINYSVDHVILGGSHGTNSYMNFKLNPIENILNTIKSLVETIINNRGGSVGGSSGSSRTGSSSGFSTGGRRRRSAVALTEEDIENDDGFMDIPDDVEDEEVPFIPDDDEEDEEPAAKPATKKKTSSKGKTTKGKSTEKASVKKKKKITANEILEEMDSDESEIDDMDDLD